MKTRRIFVPPALLTVALCWMLCLPRAQGQAVFGSVFGTVTDSTGAAVPGAKVTVTDQNKGTATVVTTNDTGNYSATHLIPDPYSVHIEASGFRRASWFQPTPRPASICSCR